MIEDREILHNGVTYSITTLYDLIDLLTEAKSLRKDILTLSSESKAVKIKEYDELIEYIDEYVLACSTMVVVYKDLFGINLQATRKEL
jgi:hypothetical protein